MTELLGDEELGIGSDARNYVPKLPRPEQVFSLRSNLRNRSSLAGLVLDVRKKDGEVVRVESHVFKVEAGSGGAPLLVAIARPLDSQPQRSEALAAAIVASAPEAILAVDRDGFVLHANASAERLLGCEPRDLVGRPAALLFGEAASDVERITASLANGDAASECEVELERPDRTRLRLDVAAGSLRPASEGCALFLRDLAPHSPVEQELRRANHELEHCVNALAHDLRSPLVALLGFSRLLRQDYGQQLDVTGRHFLDRIEQAGRTMEGLIHDLLELSRIGESGEHPSLVDPRAVLLQLKAELKPRLDEAGIRLVLPEAPPPLVYCDRTRLYQIFSNLIGNALEHMGDPGDPRIEVSVTERDDVHHLVVRDNGRGIPLEHHERIFEVFHRLGSRGDRRGGAGMGLAIVRKIAETCRGRAWVESRPGEGAAFHVVLPRP